MIEQKQIDALTSAINLFLNDLRWKKSLFQVYSIGFTLLAIVFSLAITLAGIYDKGKLAAVLGAILAALLALHRTFPFDDISFFYRSACADAENLFAPVPLILDEPTYAQVRRDFNSLRDAVAKNLPRGKNFQGVLTMREEVSVAISKPLAAPAVVQPVPLGNKPPS